MPGTEVEGCSYTIPVLDYATTYYWKVVAYNDMGETQNPSVWSFTTLADQTVNTFPWSEGFEGDIFPQLDRKSVV